RSPKARAAPALGSGNSGTEPELIPGRSPNSVRGRQGLFFQELGLRPGIRKAVDGRRPLDRLEQQRTKVREIRLEPGERTLSRRTDLRRDCLRFLDDRVLV